MTKKYKNSWKAYAAWNYEQEIEELNQASEQGWQLVRGGCFHSRFEKNPEIQYRYQMDYRKIRDIGRYLETFREQGWEYINSTFNGWHYFRKLYDPSLPEEEYEIFTDRESLKEMNMRWVRLAMIIGLVTGAMALIQAVRMILRPDLPRLIMMLTFAIESVVLLRGCHIMKDSDPEKKRKGSQFFIPVFLAVIILGSAAFIMLEEGRPYFQLQSDASSVSEPIVDEEYSSFQIRYKDYYYMDLELTASEPATLRIVDEEGNMIYEGTSTDLHEKDTCLKLTKGRYTILFSIQSGYHLDMRIE